MLGINKGWEAVKVVVKEPVWSEPCTAPTAPPSDCISMMLGIWFQRLVLPWAAHSSQYSAIVEDGVMG
jgi:hypothetical protein